jgi:hypothetical protein
VWSVSLEITTIAIGGTWTPCRANDMALLAKRETLADLCPLMSGMPILYRVESSLENGSTSAVGGWNCQPGSSLQTLISRFLPFSLQRHPGC